MTGHGRSEPLHEIAHLGHGAIFTPELEQTRWFFTALVGMQVISDEPGACYLRAFGDYEKWSLKLIAADRAGVEHVAWRMDSRQALERRVAWLEGHGHTGCWLDPDHGKGPRYRFEDPDGHAFQIYYDTERYVAPLGDQPAIPTNFQRFAAHGAGVRHLDHVNLLARDVRACREFWEKGFGLRTYEIIRRDDGSERGAWMSSSIQGHELIYTQELTAASGRLHHLAYVVDSREEVHRAAEIVADAHITIDAGPSRHTAVQGYYLYLREPGGNRIEIAHGGYLRFAPDVEPYTWSEEEWRAKPGWGAPIPPEFHVYGTPAGQARAHG